MNHECNYARTQEQTACTHSRGKSRSCCPVCQWPCVLSLPNLLSILSLSSLSSVSIQFIHFLLKLSHRTRAERHVPGHSHQGLCRRCWKPEGKRKPCHTSPTHKVVQWSGSKLPPKRWPLGPGLCPVWGLLMSALCATEPQETSALKPRLSPQVRRRPGRHSRVCGAMGVGSGVCV